MNVGQGELRSMYDIASKDTYSELTKCISKFAEPVRGTAYKQSIGASRSRYNAKPSGYESITRKAEILKPGIYQEHVRTHRQTKHRHKDRASRDQ